MRDFFFFFFSFSLSPSPSLFLSLGETNNKIETRWLECDAPQDYIGLGLGVDLVGGETIVGRGPGGVRERHVECDRLCNELAVRSHGRAQSRSLLQGAKGERGSGTGITDRASAWAVGHLGSDAHLRGPLLRRQHLQVINRTSARRLCITVVAVKFRMKRPRYKLQTQVDLCGSVNL